VRWVPGVIKQRVWGRGGLLTLPAISVMAVIGVVAIGWWGLVVLIAALGLGALMELWRESLALEGVRDRLSAEVGDARTAEKQASERATDAERRADQAEQDIVRHRGLIADLEAENRRMQTEAEAPQLTLGNLMHAVGAQIDQVALVRRHRDLSERVGASEWPVTAITRIDDHLSVKAHVGAGARELGGELVCLVDKEIERVLGTSVIRGSTGAAIETRFPIEELATLLRRAVLGRQSLDTDRFLVRLAATITAKPLEGLNDEELAKLEDLLREVNDTLAGVLVPRRPTKEETEEKH
jgi:hypothetical protein